MRFLEVSTCQPEIPEMRNQSLGKKAGMKEIFVLLGGEVKHAACSKNEKYMQT